MDKELVTRAIRACATVGKGEREVIYDMITALIEAYAQIDTHKKVEADLRNYIASPECCSSMKS